MEKIFDCAACNTFLSFKHIKTDNKSVYLKFFSTKSINFITQLFHSDGLVKNWNILKTKCALKLINGLPETWKNCTKQASENTSLLVVNDHHLLKGFRIIVLEKLSSKELYPLLISAIDHQPTSKIYFDNLFLYIELTWKKIYLTVHQETTNSHLCCFHYKIYLFEQEPFLIW